MLLTPVEYVCRVFGGVRATARAIGRGASTVSGWKRPQSKQGCDGNIPRLMQKKILDLAKKRGLDITPSDLVCGRNIKKK